MAPKTASLLDNLCSLVKPAACSQILTLIVVCFSLFFSDSLRAQTAANAKTQTTTVDASTTQAVQQTQDLLKDRAAREKIIAADPQAKSADSQLKNLTGPDADNVYALAADILPALVKNANGDPVKLQSLVADLMKNPSNFKSLLTPEQLARLKAIAARAEARQPAAPSPK